MHGRYRKTRSPYGFLFMDPVLTGKLEDIKTRIRQILEKEAYEGVMPATVDYPETFRAYENFESFHMRDSLGEDLYLRNDATAQVIKGYTNLLEYSALKEKEQKFYYMAPVFRDVRKSYPSLREVYQVGVEHIGIESTRSVAGLLKIADQIFRNVLQVSFSVLLGDVRVFHFLAREFPGEDLREIVMMRDAPSLAEVMTAKGWPAKSAQELSRLLLFSLPYEQWNSRWSSLEKSLSDQAQKELLDALRKSMKEAEETVEKLQKEGVSLRFEPLLIRKVDYYTGVIFEGYIENLTEPPLRGGAYDNLVEKYSSLKLPAGGFALDLSSILVQV